MIGTPKATGEEILVQLGYYRETMFMALNLTDQHLVPIAEMVSSFEGSTEEAIAAACREWTNNRTCKAKEVA